MNGIIDLFSGENLELVKTLEKGDWGAILFKKVKP